MTPPLHGTPDGEALRREPGAPVPIVQAPPVSALQATATVLASLGISAVGGVTAVDLIAHSATGYALIAVGACVVGVVQSVRHGLGAAPADSYSDEPPRPRAEVERDRILDMVGWGNITAKEGERLLAALQPATQVSAED